VTAWAAILALALLASGCGASAVGLHARAAQATAAVVASTGIVADAARDASLDRVQAEHAASPAEVHDAAVIAEAARWEPLGAALDATRSALLVWIESVQLAHVAGTDDVSLAALLPIAARVVLAYEAIAGMLASLGVEGAPPLPAEVRALAQGVVQ
jgi:hypothetical protein